MAFSFDGYVLIGEPRQGAPVRFVALMPDENKYYAVAAQMSGAPVGPIPCDAVGPYDTADEAGRHLDDPVVEIPPAEPPVIPDGSGGGRMETGL